MALILFGVTLSATARAESDRPPSLPPAQSGSAEANEARREEGHRHFDSGVKLYADGNFGGALAEFEAAYQLSPGAGALQNIALCQKALFRYAEAADTLTQLLARHGQSLDHEASQAVRDAIEELGALVGTVIVKATPADARITVDGRNLEPIDLGSGIRLNVGEHTLGASAPGYAATSRVIRVAGGQKERVTVELVLRPTMGFLEIRTPDSDAAIAIDGRPVAYQRWRGPLAAGVHLVQVYRPGFRAFEQQVDVEIGKSVELDARVGPPLQPSEEEPAAPAAPPGAQAAPKPRQQRGWYALGTLGVLGMPDEPKNLKHDSGIGKAKAAGGALGLRAGYRLWTPIGVELMLEWGRQQVSDVCDATVQTAERTCASSSPVKREYSLATVRVGPNLRLMSSGEKLRFSSSIGAGSVRHTFDLRAAADAPPDAAPAAHATGWNPYLMLELGLQLNLWNALLGFDAFAYIDGTSATRTRDDRAAAYRPYDGLLILGLGLRGGWSEWSPIKGSKLLQPTSQTNP